MNDVEFLALLVHRGHLNRSEAEALVPDLKNGADLDQLLAQKTHWDADQIAELRRTRAGEIPELPGFDQLTCIGTGGTADVFKAVDRRSAKTAGQRPKMVALKVLKPDSTRHTATRKAFIAEARLLERLDHANLVKCYGVARSGNTFFSMMEYIDGRTALELLDERGEFSEEEALRVILGAAEALRYLSAQGVVHRDVKPGNVMITSMGDVKLIDLGFAVSKLGGQSASPTESTVGTAAYISPEQAQGAILADSRSDVYSLGISLFHLVVGHLPFEGSDDQEVLRKQVMASLSSPELKGRGISPHLHYFIEKMVAKDAEDRYQGFDELISDIREQLRGREEIDFTAEAQRRAGTRGTRRRRH